LEILSKPEETKSCLERIVVNALQAMGKAIVTWQPEMRFLWYIIALERLVIKDREQATEERFVDRIAFALADDTESRKILVSKVKKLYDKRSRMVHNARFWNIDEEDIFFAENLALKIVVYALEKTMENCTHANFCGELHDKKY
jgi:hypothetical protein